MAQRFRGILIALIALVYVASWRGAVLPPFVIELVAPVVPKEVSDRDGIVDVVVRASEGDKGALEGVRVRAFAMLEGVAHAAAEAKSDAEGRATLHELPQAEHWIVAEAPGRARASQMVVVVSGARRLDLELGPEHLLDVDVKDESGRALANAELEVRGTDPFPVGARTDAEGHARVGRLGEGPFTVVARAPGYEEVTKRRVPEGALVSIVLGRQGALVVEVSGADGAPAAGARVLLESSGAVRVSETDKEGRVRIAGLDSGSYALRAVSGTLVSSIELGVVLSKGEERHVGLKLAPGIMITVHVVDGVTDEDVANAKVTLAESGISPFPSDGVTDKRGRVVLGPIALGPATISARAEGFVLRAATPIDGVASTEVKIALSRGGTLIGKVTDARGYAVDGATIRVVGTDLDGMPIDEDPSRAVFREAHFSAQLAGPSPLIPAGQLGVMPGTVPPIPHGVALSFGGASPTPSTSRGANPESGEPWVTGRDGTFRAAPVTPGRVRAVVHHPQYVEAMSDIVLLQSEKEATVTVVLQRGGSLEGRVVDSRGRAVSGAYVTALATIGSLERATRSGTDGSFAFAALPETITVLVAREDDASTIVARVDVTIPEAGKKTIEIALPEPRPALAVKVTDRRGTAIEAAQVSAVSLDPAEAVRVTAFSDARGQAQLAGAKGIPVRIEVRASAHASRVLMTTAETAELVVELAAAERIAGEVTARRREPLANAEVTLRTESGIRRAQTNKDGAFTIGELAPGPARLRVRLPGYAPDERAVTIEERGGRRPTEVPRFELAEEGVVEGVVVDERGDPIAGVRVAKDLVPTYLPVGSKESGMVTTDAKGKFRLGELAEGMTTIEAYAPDVGRVRRSDVRVLAGRTTSDVKLTMVRGEGSTKESNASGGVAVTLSETAAGLSAAEVVVVAVAEASEAERSGLLPGDVLVDVGGATIGSIAEARQRLSGPVHDDVLVGVRRGEGIVRLRITREAVRR